jgi:hypothetical protein
LAASVFAASLEKRKKNEQWNVTQKEKSYRSLSGFNLWCLRSGGRDVGDRGLKLGLLDGDSGSGSSFGGRHYNNRDKWELDKQPVSKK